MFESEYRLMWVRAMQKFVSLFNRMLGEDRVDSNTQTLMAGEDFAFIARCADLSTYCVFVM